MDKQAFLATFGGWMREFVWKLIGEWMRNPPGLSPFERKGTVVAVNGNKVQVKFMGELAASGAWYTCLAHYTPTVNDNVYLARDGKSWIVVGKY